MAFSKFEMINKFRIEKKKDLKKENLTLTSYKELISKE